MERKVFSYAKRIQIAQEQNYMCVGHFCKGNVFLGAQWELDHIKPLFMGGNNERSNLQMICPNCHAYKTQNERIVKGECNEYEKKLRSDTWEFLIDTISDSVYVFLFIY